MARLGSISHQLNLRIGQRRLRSQRQVFGFFKIAIWLMQKWLGIVMGRSRHLLEIGIQMVVAWLNVTLIAARSSQAIRWARLVDNVAIITHYHAIYFPLSIANKFSHWIIKFCIHIIFLSFLPVSLIVVDFAIQACFARDVVCIQLRGLAGDSAQNLALRFRIIPRLSLRIVHGAVVLEWVFAR